MFKEQLILHGHQYKLILLCCFVSVWYYLLMDLLCLLTLEKVLMLVK